MFNSRPKVPLLADYELREMLNLIMLVFSIFEVTGSVTGSSNDSQSLFAENSYSKSKLILLEKLLEVFFRSKK